jgi:hypothetical protein
LSSDGKNRKPSHRDYGEFFLLAVQFRILDVSHVRAWADGLMEQTDIPPAWMIDLSLCDIHTAAEYLRNVPGDADADLVDRLIAACVRKRWRLGLLSTDRVVKAGAGLFCEGEWPQPRTARYWGARVDSKDEGRTGGWEYCSDAAFDQFVAGQLTPFAEYEALLPREVAR